jgi:CelD/BcsL family acetyltransferase involved in cellulose biosynthesis
MNTNDIICDLQCRIIRGIDEIAAISEDWDDLFSRAHEAPAYFSRAWVQPFINEKQVKGQPLLVTVWSDSKLVALLPLTICNYFGIKIAKIVPTTILNYTGLLLDPEYPDSIHTIIEVLARDKIAHAFYNKYTMLLDKDTNRFFEELSNYGFTCRRWERNRCLWTLLEPDFDEVLKSRRTGEQRRWLLNKERRLFKDGDITVNCYNGKDITPEIISRIAAIQKDSWLKEEGKVVFEQPFYQKLLLETGKAGMTYIWLMTKGGEDAAFICSFIVKDRLYLKWLSYRNKYGASSSLSFGKVLFMQMVRYACDNGIRMLDFGFGLDDWKGIWAKDHQNIDLIISGRGSLGRLSLFLCDLFLDLSKCKWRFQQGAGKLRMAFKTKNNLLNYQKEIHIL